METALKKKIDRLSDEELNQLQIASSARIDGLNGLTESVFEIARELFTEEGVASGGKACPTDVQEEILELLRARMT